jgi:glycine/D-amino acid oxidase-like deaminating enzyme
MERYDAIVIGGGLVGSAIAYGLARADDRGRHAQPDARTFFGPTARCSGRGLTAYLLRRSGT